MDLRRKPRRLNASPRQLAFRHGRRRLRALAASVENEPPSLQPGEEQLYSFYVPGLQAGEHSIQVDQNIQANSQALNPQPSSSHDFNVIGPRFSLPDGAVNSFYPPQGHSDQCEVIPHVVFEDPTLPWERVASQESETTHPPDYNRNRVPWLAVLVFTEEELRLSQEDLADVLKNTSVLDGKQSGSLSINMLAKEAEQLQRVTPAILYDPVSDDDDVTTDAIFLRAALFNSLFTRYDADGVPDATQTQGYVYHHRYLAHLRHIHLDGTPAAATTDDDDHAYSVVVGHRTGPLDITKPTTVIAHLVNIEHVEAMTMPVSTDFVAMSSLLSWQYTCLPPSSWNVYDAFVNLGNTLSVLRPTLGPGDLVVRQGVSPIQDRVLRRLQDGFSLLRYRIQTGEITAAFTRSPFTPTSVQFPSESPNWPAGSTTGTRLQILDPQLNLLDVTYSAAWTLGKTLGLAHPEFATALARVRKQISDLAVNEAQASALARHATRQGIPTRYKTAEQVVATLAKTVSQVAALPRQMLLPKKPDGMLHRWYHPNLPHLNLAAKGGDLEEVDYVKAALIVAGTPDDPTVPYNEYNTAFSADWAIVLSWVMDRYYVADVPSHYLITDPSHVPEESLRIFTIDHNWVSAMIDGGLSLANHLDPSDDGIRDAIKVAINRYLHTHIPDLNYKPPVPRYGFYLRSELVTKFPDLIVDLDPPPSPEYAPVILRHEVVSPGTMLCLLREPPVQSEFKSLYLREPPHQQYFSAAAEIDPNHVKMEYRRIYTKSEETPPDPDYQEPIPYTSERQAGTARESIFIWGSTSTATDIRCLNVDNLAAQYLQQLQKTYDGHPDWYTDPTPNAAMMAAQLSEPQWQLHIALPDATTFPALFHDEAERIRTLPLGSKSPSPSDLPPALASPSIPVAPHPPFGHRTRRIPLHPLHPPPHFRLPRQSPIKIPVPSPHPPPPTPPDPAGPPQFTYQVYPVSQAASTDHTIPMQTLPQDLVFSIVFDSGSYDYIMTRLQISLSLTDQWRLMDNYSGTGPTMLSNLRFNVLAQFSSDGNWLVLTLKPRSTTGQVPVSSIDEMGFLLSGVVVKQYDEVADGNTVNVNIDVEEDYVLGGPQKYSFYAKLRSVGEDGK